MSIDNLFFTECDLKYSGERNVKYITSTEYDSLICDAEDIAILRSHYRYLTDLHKQRTLTNDVATAVGFGDESVDKHRCQLGHYDRSALAGIYVYLQSRVPSSRRQWRLVMSRVPSIQKKIHLNTFRQSYHGIMIMRSHT